MSINTIRTAINSINSISDLRQVQTILHARMDYIQRACTSNFSIGQKVYFISSKTGRRITGRVTKVNQKTITLMTDDSHAWKVSSSLVQHL